MVSKQQRQRQLARDKVERQQARRVQRQRRLRRRGIVVGAVIVVVLALVGGFGVIQLANGAAINAEPPPKLPTDAPSDKGKPSAEADPGTCSYVVAPVEGKMTHGLPPEQVPKALLTGSSTAKIETDRGTISVALDTKAAPCAVNSLAHLAEQDVYADQKCSELATEPASTRYLGCAPDSGGSGYLFAKEHEQREVGAGRLVLAASGDSNGTRLLLTYGESTFDSPVTVLGKVESGVDVLEQVAKGGIVPEDGADTGNGKASDSASKDSKTKGVGRPKTSVVIEDIKVTTKT